MESLNEISWSSEYEYECESDEMTTNSNASRGLGTMLQVCMARAIGCNQQMVASCVGGDDVYNAYTTGCDYC